MVSPMQKSCTIGVALLCFVVLYGFMVTSTFHGKYVRNVVANVDTKSDEVTLATKVEDTSNNHQLKINRKLKLRKQDKTLLEKLTENDKKLESCTDPQPLSPTCSSHVYLLILVVSAPGNQEQRNAIRGSWASTYHLHSHALNSIRDFPDAKTFALPDVVKTVFLIGRDAKDDVRNLVNTEAKTFGDIVLGTFEENYRNLTMKTRLGLKWAYYYCRADFVLKTDDDVFVNPVPLVEWLKSGLQKGLYTGWCNFGSVVVRDKGNKWYVSEEDFSEAQYPGYCLGGGYLFSDDVLHKVMLKSYGRKLFPMEDLYVGIMISEIGGIEARDERKHFDLVFNGRSSCKTTSLFLAHRVAPADQLYWLTRYEQEQASCS